MRNSTSISKAVVKLAAAALVVAGGVGAVWAQPAGLLPSGAPTAVMGVSYTVENIAELRSEAKNPTEAELGQDYINDVTVSDFGNLGTLTVKTNATAWDILMKTENGGRLVDASSGSRDSSPIKNVWGDTTGWDYVNNGANCLVYRATGTTTAAGILEGSSSAPDTVLLKVAIGVAKTGKALGAGGANAAKLFPMSNVTATVVTPVPPIGIASNALLKSQSFIETTSLYSPRANISFAKVIGDGYDGTAPTGAFTNGILGTPGPTWASIASNGFPKPAGNEVDLEEHFYINVQVDETLGSGLGANKSGNYSEKFYLDLAVNF